MKIRILIYKDFLLVGFIISLMFDFLIEDIIIYKLKNFIHYIN